MVITPSDPAFPPEQSPEMIKVPSAVTWGLDCVMVIVGPDVLLVHEPLMVAVFPAASVWVKT